MNRDDGEQKPVKLKLSTGSRKAKRERYWATHGGKPTRKIITIPGMQRRLHRVTILDQIEALGKMSDVAVLKASRKEDLVRNLAFAVYQQRLWGALDRLKRQNPFTLKIPPKIELARLASAGKSIEEAV